MHTDNIDEFIFLGSIRVFHRCGVSKLSTSMTYKTHLIKAHR